MVRISIVTITYNAGTVLQRTLDSVLQQTYPCVEHLIVDGASTDDTVRLAETYREQAAAMHPEWSIDVKSEPDGGLYDAMNKGLSRATGDYIVFMNAGDTLAAPDTLETVERCAEVNPRPAVIYGDTDVTDGDGRVLCKRRLRPPETLTWRSFRKGMLVCHQAFYARTDIAKTFPYDLRYRHSADVKWCIQIMKAAEEKGLSLVNTHATLCNYMREGDSTKNHRASLCERFNVMKEAYGLPTTIAMHAWFVVRAVIK